VNLSATAVERPSLPKTPVASLGWLPRLIILVRAEFVRSFLQVWRYPVEMVTGLIIMYTIFMGIFLGAKSLSGGAPLGSSLDGLVIRYYIWFFVIMALNQMGFTLEIETQVVTLEQLALNRWGILRILITRALVSMTFGFIQATILLTLILVSTRRMLHVNFFADILVLVVTIAGLYGFGLILGGATLIFKRVGQVGAILQFVFLMLAFLPLDKMPAGARSVAVFLPMTLGSQTLVNLMVAQQPFFSPTIVGNLGWVALNSAVYIAIGVFIFRYCERVAKEYGLLGHY
jgi:ABC-2 type transport system permease protein